MKRLVTGGAVLAFILGSTASMMGCGGSSSGNPAKSALDSLPNAPLNQDTAKVAAASASSAAVGAQQVPQASDFASTGTLPTYGVMAARIMAARDIPFEVRSAAAGALGRLGTQAVTTGCPTVTDNSTFPTGTSVDVTVDAGTGCSAGTGVTLSGSMTLKGTIDAAAGTVDVKIAVNNFAETMACSTGGLTVTLNGSGSASATGLTAASTAFTVAQKTNVTIGFGGTCNSQSLSGSGFIFLDATLTATRSGNVWTFDAAESGGTEILAAGTKFGEYYDWKGTLTVDTKGTLTGADDTGTVAITGRVGWDDPVVGKGKVDITYNANFDHAVCFDEPVSGTLQLGAGSNTAVMTFDGATNGCGCAPWTLNGVAGTPNPLCW